MCVYFFSREKCLCCTHFGKQRVSLFLSSSRRNGEEGEKNLPFVTFDQLFFLFLLLRTIRAHFGMTAQVFFFLRCMRNASVHCSIENETRRLRRRSKQFVMSRSKKRVEILVCLGNWAMPEKGRETDEKVYTASFFLGFFCCIETEFRTGTDFLTPPLFALKHLFFT